MKNFPHQINQLPKFVRALETIAGLVDGGADVSDDGAVGDALARADVYAFRNPDGKGIEELLQLEHAKPSASQGSRTFARDLRRFFELLGFVARGEDQHWAVSPSARALITFHRGGQLLLAYDIWRQALLDLKLEDATGSSHPYRLLIRLLRFK